jgi:tripeptide aminopeptidase
MSFAKELAEELKTLGLSEVEVSEYGYVTATIPATDDSVEQVVGFIAHMDTSPDFSGHNVKPRVITNYDGSNIMLNKDLEIEITTEETPELLKYVGQDIVVTDGTTLLGADDKAGIAEIITAAEYLIANPQIKHGKIRICFTPDEEIGQGADNFDVEKFGADFAYTFDGGEVGEFEYETFNAASAKIIFRGFNVHPGYGYGKMRNAIRIASTYMQMLPRHETPEHTKGYEGFYHIVSMTGTVERAEVEFIIRDFKRDRFEDRKGELVHLANKINSEFGDGTAEITIKDQYYNMREKIEPKMYIVDYVKQAIEDCGMDPMIVPVRGGTDGSRLSFMGLPTPNIFAGGVNFHSKYEFVPVQSMEKAVDVIVRICQLVK